jgi:hypothetical protein
MPIIAMNDSNSRCNIKIDDATGKVKLTYETGHETVTKCC